MVYRVFLLLILATTTLGASWRPRAETHVSPDVHIIQSASKRLGTESPATVMRWLRGHRSVASAVMGKDGQTIDVQFGDGIHGTILTRLQRTMKVSGRALVGRVRPRLRNQQAAPPRATVLEPFADQLGLGPNAGDVEVADLRAAGFQVDQAYNTQVTVALMQTLTQYNVVYMHTHSGIDRAGNGVVMTGQLATTGDPAIQPFLTDGTVEISGVAGSTAAYYGISTRFVTAHMGQFPHDSFLFINGCALRKSDFFTGLSARGAGALVSWDADVTAQDGYLSAAAFFYFMGQGMTIADAIGAAIGAGAGTSNYNGQVATLGVVGDGTITLKRAGGTIQAPASTATATATARVVPTNVVPTSTAVLPATSVPATSTATPAATAKPTATPTPTATPVPTATATSTPGIMPELSLVSSVKPGSKQTISVARVAPNTDVFFLVTFPNGDKLRSRVSPDGNAATFAFVQDPSKITRRNNTASVTIQGGQMASASHAVVSATDTYKIGFSKIDVSAEPRVPNAGRTVVIWVHTAPRTQVRVIPKVSKLNELRTTTGQKGWTHVTYILPPGMQSGRKVTVRVEAMRAGRLVHSATNFTVG